jgi:farnesyl diphosphate synthase
MVRPGWPIACLRAAGRLMLPTRISINDDGIRRFLPLINSQLFITAGMSDIIREHDTTASATKCSRMDVISNTSVATHNGSGCNGVQNGDVRLKATSECTDDLQKFDDMFTTLADDLSRVDDPVISDALRWFRRVNEYNVPYGKKNRGLTVIHSYRYLAGDRCSEEGVKLAMILGWCVEWLQAYFLVSDDVMDSSVTRRGQPCWYRQEDVKLVAINDSFFLECSVYVLLKKYFRHLPYYTDLMDLFHETTLQTVIGQNLDLITAPTDRVNFAAYTIERYNAIVKYKTAFYSFYLPVACAMYMNGISDKKSHDDARTILLKMGEYFQIQDDFLDCFGDPAVTGKVGTDIEDNKCSWLIVQALSRASVEQRAVLEANYGRHDPDCIATVKSVYAELKLPQLYSDYEEQSYVDILRLIDDLSGTLPRDMFISYAQKIYKRQK